MIISPEKTSNIQIDISEKLSVGSDGSSSCCRVLWENKTSVNTRRVAEWGRRGMEFKTRGENKQEVTETYGGDGEVI